jgi:Cd2+/Zn2+-exporting ATPase
VVKGENYLEALGRVDTVVFDKTGTLTHGRFSVVETLPVPGMEKGRLVEYAAFAESRSSHPIATTVRAMYPYEIDPDRVRDIAEQPGRGVTAVVDDVSVAVGTRGFLKGLRIETDPDAGYGTTIHVAVSGYAIGRLILDDEPRPDAAGAVAALKKLSIRRIALLSGEAHEAVGRMARAVGITESWGELRPEGKMTRFKELLRTARGTTVFVGDALHDAPMLALAGVGVSMGVVGSEGALEASDVVLMSDRPSKLAEVIAIARRTRRITFFNIALLLSMKLLLLTLGAYGLISLWEAVLADAALALAAMLNAARLIYAPLFRR